MRRRLTPADERMVTDYPAGAWRDMVAISLCKGALQRSMPAELQLRYVTVLENFAAGFVGGVELIPPACHATFEIWHEAMKGGDLEFLPIIARDEVRLTLIALQPAFVDAIRANPRHGWRRLDA